MSYDPMLTTGAGEHWLSFPWPWSKLDGIFWQGTGGCTGAGWSAFLEILLEAVGIRGGQETAAED